MVEVHTRQGSGVGPGEIMEPVKPCKPPIEGPAMDPWGLRLFVGGLLHMTFISWIIAAIVVAFTALLGLGCAKMADDGDDE